MYLVACAVHVVPVEADGTVCAAAALVAQLLGVCDGDVGAV